MNSPKDIQPPTDQIAIANEAASKKSDPVESPMMALLRHQANRYNTPFDARKKNAKRAKAYAGRKARKAQMVKRKRK